MNFNSLITCIAGLFCGGLAVFLLFKDRKSFVHRTFAIGMITLGIDAVFRGLSLRAFLPEEIIRWQRAGFYTASFLSGIWLVFSLSFSRVGDKRYLMKWRWVILATFLFPLALVTLFEKSLFKGNPIWETSSHWVLPLGWSGYLLHILFLIPAINAVNDLNNIVSER